MPTLDLRGVLKGTLRDHLGISDSHLEDTVFPNSQEATRWPGCGAPDCRQRRETKV